MNFKKKQNTEKTYIFRLAVPSGSSGKLEQLLVGHGYITAVRIRCAVGDGGKLHVRPVVVIPQEIEIDLFNYAKGGNRYVSGDDETVESAVRYEVENQALLRVYYDNTDTDETSDDGQLSVDITVAYNDIFEPENIIGPRSGGGY